VKAEVIALCRGIDDLIERWAEKVAGCMKMIAEAGQCSCAGAGVSDI